MSLLDVRKQFVEETGRVDLVVDAAGGDYSDDGADTFIQAGQRYLDGLFDFSKEAAEISKTLAQGEFSVDLDASVRAVQRVRLEQSDGIDYLQRLSLRNAYEDYGDDSTLANAEEGTPDEYAVGINRTLSGTSNETQKKLLILPPADGSYDIVIEALVGSASLSSDTDTSFWTEQYPHLLVQAAKVSHAEAYRNQTAVENAKRNVRDRARQIDFDVVAETAFTHDQMDDSWDERKFLRL